VQDFWEADTLHQQALALAEEHTRQTGRQLPGVGLAHNALAALQYERNHLDVADRHAAKGIELFKPWGVTENLLDSYDISARIKLAQRDVPGALALTELAISLVQDPSVPDWLQGMVATRQARLQLMAEKTKPEQLTTVARWAVESGLNPDEEPGYAREGETILLARYFLSKGEAQKALTLLDRLALLAERGERIGRLIEVLILKARSLQDIGKTDEALSTLDRAFTLAEPEGYLRIFVDEGSPMARLLAKAATRGIAIQYANQLLRAFPVDAAEKEPDRLPLLHPLSVRELEVLRLLPTGQTGPQIAERLYLSNNTVKTHVRNIYSKLNVNNRAEAIERARALDLLP